MPTLRLTIAQLVIMTVYLYSVIGPNISSLAIRPTNCNLSVPDWYARKLSSKDCIWTTADSVSNALRQEFDEIL